MQHLDTTFVGLIFSCFDESSGREASGVVRLTAFQAVPAGGHAGAGAANPVDIPVTVARNPTLPAETVAAVVEVQRMLLEEESDAFRESRVPGASALSQLGAVSAHARALCTLAECVTLPLAMALQARADADSTKAEILSADMLTLAGEPMPTSAGGPGDTAYDDMIGLHKPTGLASGPARSGPKRSLSPGGV
jgi:BRCC36-like protein